MKSKKGVSFSTLNLFFWRLLFLTIVFALIWYLTSSQINAKTDIKQTKNFIIIKRALSSPTSFIYSDPNTGRFYPDIIDLKKFDDEELLNNSINVEKNLIAVKFELKDLDTDKSYYNYLNRKWYDRLAPLVQFDKYDKDIKWKYVLIKTENGTNKGLLRIDVVTARE